MINNQKILSQNICNYNKNQELWNNYQIRNLNLSNNILEFINNYGNYFFKNKTCLCNLWIKNDHSNQITKSIKNIQFLIKKTENIQFLKKLILKKIPVKYFDKINYPAISYNLKKDSIWIVSGDSFSNQNCINLIINLILKNKILNYVFLYDSFYCEHNKKYIGYNIFENPDIIDNCQYIKNIEPVELDEIIKQILTILSFLKCSKYGFVHNNLIWKNITIIMKNNKPIYKIGQFEYSSIYWKNIKFCNKPQENLNFKISDKFYKLVDSSELGWIYIPLSYDIYCFMFSIMREYPIWQKYIANPHSCLFFKLWRQIFLESDLIKIENNLKELFKNQQYYKKLYDYLIEKSNDKLPEILKDKTNKSNLKIFIPIRKQIIKIENHLKNIEGINYDFKKNNLFLKFNLDFVYEAYNINSPSHINKQIDNFHNHIL